MNEIDKHTMIWQCKDSLAVFFKEAWKIIEPEKELIWNWHHEYLAGELERRMWMVGNGEVRVDDLLINVPPGTTKSSLVTVVFPVWCWLHFPGMKFITASYDESLAIFHAVKSRDIIKSDWFVDLFSGIFILKYDVNKKSEYQNNAGGHRIAVGVGGAATGKHGDFFIVDDPINPKKAASRLQIDTVNHWWDKTVVNRMTEPSVSQKIVVMQRLAVEDLTGHCLGKPDGKYKHICLPAESSEKVKPKELIESYIEGLLDPVRLTKNVLMFFRGEMGSLEYSGQYDQDPLPAGGNLINPQWFGRFSLDKLEAEVYDEGKKLIWNVFIDGAYTEDETNDPSALLCAAQWGADLYVRDVEEVWMELPEIIKFVPNFVGRNRMNGESKIVIEPKASGLSIGQMLRKYTDLNVVIDKPPRDGKTERVKAKLPYMEGGRVFLLDGAPWLDKFMGQVKAFPSSMVHDDIVDCLTMAIDRVEGRAKSKVMGFRSIG
jgi:predicted phage terminase large subunit-like protein